jgi:hypothetical protein
MVLDMATIDNVARLIASLPEVAVGERHGTVTWFVNNQAFAWVRPFSKADLKRFGAVPPPESPIVAARVADLAEKEAVLATSPAIFTIPHFEGYPAVLIQLKTVTEPELRDTIIGAWLACAPAQLADSYLASRKIDLPD